MEKEEEEVGGSLFVGWGYADGVPLHAEVVGS